MENCAPYQPMTPAQRAQLVRDQVMETWNPPTRAGESTMADVAQTAVMQTIAFIMGKESLGELTYEQELAIDQGLEMFEAELIGRDDSNLISIACPHCKEIVPTPQIQAFQKQQLVYLRCPACENHITEQQINDAFKEYQQ